MEKIGKLVAEARIHLGLTVKGVAAVTGLSEEDIVRFEQTGIAEEKVKRLIFSMLQIKELAADISGGLLLQPQAGLDARDELIWDNISALPANRAIQDPDFLFQILNCANMYRFFAPDVDERMAQDFFWMFKQIGEESLTLDAKDYPGIRKKLKQLLEELTMEDLLMFGLRTRAKYNIGGEVLPVQCANLYLCPMHEKISSCHGTKQ